ncbi:hypothetical protein HALLA_20680 (plasmid) [Halostagnicola larsenii XH-48]|uniref:Uncharacterized protein n=1 Tax=Halostagnicola larsenii XH-48 TaxID=797299 RepID=W0JUS2_9EURY|nr:hypothetical protein [Halostagnicola larsenii]AHG02321.1 hypothetical protein HALLA_20680 [Halostagnicola larsenii XH-48]
MGHTYRTEPDPPEEPTECSSRDAVETTEAFYDGIWVAVSSMFGVLFLVLVMIQMTRMIPDAAAYGDPTATTWITLFVAALLLLGVIGWGLKKRPHVVGRTDTRGTTE